MSVRGAADMMTTKGASDVTTEVSMRDSLHGGDKAHKRVNSPWLWNPGYIIPEVQDRFTSGPSYFLKNPVRMKKNPRFRLFSCFDVTGHQKFEYETNDTCEFSPPVPKNRIDTHPVQKSYSTLISLKSWKFWTQLPLLIVWQGNPNRGRLIAGCLLQNDTTTRRRLVRERSQRNIHVMIETNFPDRWQERHM